MSVEQNNTDNSNTLIRFEPQVASPSLQEQRSSEEDVTERLQNIGLPSELGRDVELVRNPNQLTEPTGNLSIENAAQRTIFPPNSVPTGSSDQGSNIQQPRSTNEYNFPTTSDIARMINELHISTNIRMNNFNRTCDLLHDPGYFLRNDFYFQRERWGVSFNNRRRSAHERFRFQSVDSNYSKSDHSDSGSDHSDPGSDHSDQGCDSVFDGY
ncbi:UNVERIFIED_CONTAM: hypothetical protein RMT77_005867 [Armadillidium vulgare]